LQMHRELTSTPAQESMQDDAASLVDVNASTGRIWLGKSCVKESWKYDKWGKNVAYWVKSCGWWGCVPVLKFKWRFGWKRIGAGACEYGNNAWNLANWWCPKYKRRVQQADFLNPFNFERCLDDENWFDQIIKAMEMLPNILKVLENMDGCMKGLRGLDAKWKPSNVLTFYTKRAVDPVRLFKDLDRDYLIPTMKALEPWFTKTIKRAVKDGQEFLKVASNEKWQPTEAWANEVVDKGWDLIASEKTGLVSVEGMGALKCLKRRFGAPIYKASKPVIVKAVIDVIAPAVSWLARELKVIEKWFQDRISEAVKGDGWFSHLVKMVRAAIFQTCLNKWDKLDFRSIAKANPKLELDKVAINLVSPFFENVKDWSKFHVVTPIASKLGEASTEINGMITKNIDGLSGIIPFWGGLVGALISSAQNVGKMLETTFSKEAIIKGFDSVFGWIEKEAKKLIKKGLENLDRNLNSNPVGVVVMALLQKSLTLVGGPLVKGCQNSIEALITLRNKSKAYFDQMKAKYARSFKPTPRPLPTPKPTAKPTPPTTTTTTTTTTSTTITTTTITIAWDPKHMVRWKERGPWSECWENWQCKKNLTARFGPGSWDTVLTNMERHLSNKGVRRRDSWRDHCIELSCQELGAGFKTGTSTYMTWNQQYWRDCGSWKFSGLCTEHDGKQTLGLDWRKR